MAQVEEAARADKEAALAAAAEQSLEDKVSALEALHEQHATAMQQAAADKTSALQQKTRALTLE